MTQRRGKAQTKVKCECFEKECKHSSWTTHKRYCKETRAAVGEEQLQQPPAEAEGEVQPEPDPASSCQCGVCKRGFKTQRDLSIHTLKEHG